MYKKLFVILSLVLISIPNQSKACSIQIQEDQIKNLMIAAAASNFNVALTKATKIEADNFSYRLYGQHPNSSCENHLEFTTQVTIKYKPNLLETCTLSVETVYTQNLNATDFPYEEYAFNLPTSSCSRIPIRVLPRPIPIRRN